MQRSALRLRLRRFKILTKAVLKSNAICITLWWFWPKRKSDFKEIEFASLKLNRLFYGLHGLWNGGKKYVWKQKNSDDTYRKIFILLVQSPKCMQAPLDIRGFQLDNIGIQYFPKQSQFYKFDVKLVETNNNNH